MIVGAGIAGLTAAVDLARQGIAVTVLERAAAPGGKMRELETGGVALDAGPTVFTMRWVFDALFADAGSTLAEHLTLTKSRHPGSARVERHRASRPIRRPGAHRSRDR